MKGSGNKDIGGKEWPDEKHGGGGLNSKEWPDDKHHEEESGD